MEPLGTYPPPPKDLGSQLRTHYWLDLASLLPPLLLDCQPGNSVLDMCSAPGGKSLVLAHQLFNRVGVPQGGDGGPSSMMQSDATRTPGRLVCNEIDGVRRERLSKVLQDYLPPACRKYVKVTGHDATRHWGRFEASLYDRVLVDVPCSSERHVVQQGLVARSKINEKDWSVKRCRELAQLQQKMLMGAARALKPGGRLVYSTCSLTSLENDEVVRSCCQQLAGRYRLWSPSECEAQLPPGLAGVAGVEHTQLGLICLPDCAGHGPLFMAVLERGSSVGGGQSVRYDSSDGGGSSTDGEDL